MQTTGRFVLGAVLIPLVVSCVVLPAEAGKIDAVRGKQYQLTKQHGPWMIMVATFREPPEGLRTRGMSPEEAADEVVFELRKKGIPAYTFSQDDVYDQVQTIDRHGRERSRTVAAQKGGICVLAGNYSDPDGRIAQKTLSYVKRFRPEVLSDVKQKGKFLQNLKNGGLYRATPGRPGPLSGAFLTINPMLSPEEALQRKQDPLILRLNSGMEHSLLNNPGKYTLIVASFYGQSVTQVERSKIREAEKSFKVSDSLDLAAQHAWEMTQALRKGNFVIRQGDGPPRQQPFEAYLYHDRHRSLVTIGSFDRPDDPEIRRLQNLFKAKVKSHPQTGRDFLAAETLTIPAIPRQGVPPEKSWIFDPEPTLMQVPKLR